MPWHHCDITVSHSHFVWKTICTSHAVFRMMLSGFPPKNGITLLGQKRLHRATQSRVKNTSGLIVQIRSLSLFQGENLPLSVPCFLSVSQLSLSAKATQQKLWSRVKRTYCVFMCRTVSRPDVVSSWCLFWQNLCDHKTPKKQFRHTTFQL